MTELDLNLFLKKYIAEVSEAGDYMFSEQMPELTEELFSVFEHTGNRLTYENVYFHRRKFLAVYGILSILYKKERDIKKLEMVIQDICHEICWALPAHVNRREDKNWQITIDLFAAETAFSLAEIVGRLQGSISQKTYELVEKEVFRRVLLPFLDSEKPYAWWECSHMNWCAVCNGSVGGAAIWLMKDKEKLELLLSRICSSIMNYLDGFSGDGACLEGIGYYTYGMSYFTAFADLVHEYSRGRICLTGSDKFKKIACFQQKCFLPGKFSLCFSDSSDNEKFRVGLTAYLAMIDKNVIFPDMEMAAGLESDPCYRYIILSRDIFFTEKFCKDVRKKNIANITNITSFHTVLPQAQWSVCCSKNRSIFAIKGGNNEEPHNHNDVGSFLYVYEGEQILADIGAGEYTQDYFNENRYENICCRSLGHNVPVINGREQKSGGEYKASYFNADGRGKTMVGIEEAYGLDRDEKISRSAVFDLESGDCTIKDEFVLHSGSHIVENLISIYQPEIVEDGFLLHTKHADVMITCGSKKDYTVQNQQYFNHSGDIKQVWLIQWKVWGNVEEIKIHKVNGG